MVEEGAGDVDGLDSTGERPGPQASGGGGPGQGLEDPAVGPTVAEHGHPGQGPIMEREHVLGQVVRVAQGEATGGLPRPGQAPDQGALDGHRPELQIVGVHARDQALEGRRRARASGEQGRGAPNLGVPVVEPGREFALGIVVAGRQSLEARGQAGALEGLEVARQHPSDALAIGDLKGPGDAPATGLTRAVEARHDPLAQVELRPGEDRERGCGRAVAVLVGPVEDRQQEGVRDRRSADHEAADVGLEALLRALVDLLEVVLGRVEAPIPGLEQELGLLEVGALDVPE